MLSMKWFGIFFFIALLYTCDQTLGLLGWAIEVQRTTPMNKQNIYFEWDANNPQMFWTYANTQHSTQV
jgi:hypothetical protein